jgi:predicted nuclease of predicted toxin-antitoxin system
MTAKRWLLDMGVSNRVGEWLRMKGHDAVHLRDVGLQRLSDDLIFERAAHEGRIILTFDLDFADIAAHSALDDVCVVVFRLRNTRAFHVIERLNKVLADNENDLSASCIITVEEARIRVRKLPIQ